MMSMAAGVRLVEAPTKTDGFRRCRLAASHDLMSGEDNRADQPSGRDLVIRARNAISTALREPEQ